MSLSSDLQTAKDPNTPVRALVSLRRHSNRDVLRAIAQNPNAPLPLLAGLPPYCAGALLQNPALPLLMLENPNLLSALQPRLAAALLVLPEAPEVLRAQALSGTQEDLLRAIAQNSTTPHSILQQLAGSQSTAVRCAVAANKMTSGALLTQLSYDRATSVSDRVLSNPNVTEDILARYISGDAHDRRMVAQSPKLSSGLQARLCVDPGWDVRRLLAKNPVTSAEHLRTLAGDDREAIRLAVAYHPNVHADTLAALFQDSALELELLRHPAAPVSLLERFQSSPSPEILSMIAMNPAATKEILRCMAARVSSSWRARPPPWVVALLEHPNAPEALLREQASSVFVHVLRSIAKNPSTPLGVLRSLAKNTDHHTSRIASQRLNTVVVCNEPR